MHPLYLQINRIISQDDVFSKETWTHLVEMQNKIIINLIHRRVKSQYHIPGRRAVIYFFEVFQPEKLNK